jgi:hypothetical protein
MDKQTDKDSQSKSLLAISEKQLKELQKIMDTAEELVNKLREGK